MHLIASYPCIFFSKQASAHLFRSESYIISRLKPGYMSSTRRYLLFEPKIFVNGIDLNAYGNESRF